MRWGCRLLKSTASCYYLSQESLGIFLKLSLLSSCLLGEKHVIVRTVKRICNACHQKETILFHPFPNLSFSDARFFRSWELSKLSLLPLFFGQDYHFNSKVSSRTCDISQEGYEECDAVGTLGVLRKNQPWPHEKIGPLKIDVW